jgi:hypothetical protein
MVSELSRRAMIAFPLSVLVSGAGRAATSQLMSCTAAPLPRLSYAGTELAPVVVDRADVNISVTVDLAGDHPKATYITARPRGMPALQRTAAGAWVAWDQRTQSLIDNRFAPSGPHLVFAFFGTNFSRQSFPVTLSVAYRTLAGVKFGVLTITPKA